MTAGFNPLSLNPALWLDASDASTLYDATSGGSLVTADGAIARWIDKSGNARHPTQSTSAYRPIRKTAVKNGRDVIRFDGTDDFFDVTAFPTTSIDFSVFLVGKNAAKTFTGSHSNDLQAYIDQDHSGGSGWAFQTRPDIGAGIMTASAFPNTGGNSNGAVITQTENVFNVLDFSRVASGSEYLALNGATPAVNASTVAWVPRSSMRIGKTVGFNRPLNGDIAEILIFSRILNSSERSTVLAYLATKYEITIA